MNRSPIAVVALAILAFPSCSLRLKKNLGRLDELLDRHVAEGRVAGVVALVLRDGEPFYERAAGWRDREGRSVMAANTLFRIASQTKALTSAAILMLAEEKKLSVHDPVARFIPAFAQARVVSRAESGARRLVAAEKQITIHHLLTHTSGISYGMHAEVADYYRNRELGLALQAAWNLSGLPLSICAAAEKIAQLPLLTQPGAGWTYGYSTDILACVVERASGQSLDEFFRGRIFVPLEMKDTAFFPASEAATRMAALYGSDKNGFIERFPGSGLFPYIEGPRRLFSGGAGLVSTAMDYAVFLEMIRRGGAMQAHSKELRLLSPESVKLMTTTRIPPQDGLGFGYGFETTDAPGARGLESVGSFGWSGAYGTAYRVDPKQGLTIILMLQLIPNQSGIREKFWSTLYQALADADALR